MNDITTDTTLVDTGVAPAEVLFDADGHPVLPAVLDIRKGDAVESATVQSVDEVGTNEVQ